MKLINDREINDIKNLCNSSILLMAIFFSGCGKNEKINTDLLKKSN